MSKNIKRFVDEGNVNNAEEEFKTFLQDDVGAYFDEPLQYYLMIAFCSGIRNCFDFHFDLTDADYLEPHEISALYDALYDQVDSILSEHEKNINQVVIH